MNDLNRKQNISTCPKGETFLLPERDSYKTEFERLKSLAENDCGE